MSDIRKKRRFWSWLWIALTGCFMICVFTPLETYFTNSNEFWYGPGQLLPIVAAAFGVSFIAFCILYAILHSFKCFGYIIIFAFFSLIGLYIQGNIIPRPYGVLDGKEIVWSEYLSLALASILIIAGVILCTLLTVLFLKGKIYRFIPWVCAFLLFIQAGTLTVMTVMEAKTIGKNKEDHVVTDHRVFSLSKNKNFVIILLDTFEQSTMTDLLNAEGGNELKASLPGFVYYPDTVGCYPNTAGALPYMLEGKWYTNEKPLYEFIQDAYASKPPLFEALDQADYSVGAYVSDVRRLDQNHEKYINVFHEKYIVSDNFDFFKNIYKMVAFNYAPHQLKSRFLVYSGNFDMLRRLHHSASSDYDAYNYQMVPFYQKFKEKGLSFTEEQNAFRYYYTEGVHQSYTFDENLVETYASDLTCDDEAKGCLKFLREFVEELKAAGAYDRTAIIVYADHSDGWRVNRGSNPLFMVKNFNDNRPFEISDTAVSYEDLQATYASIALETVLPGSIWSEDIAKRTERRYLWYHPGGGFEHKNYFPPIREYMVRGFAGDPDAMYMTGNIYEREKAYHVDHYFAYTLGETLLFTNDEQTSADHYMEYGLSYGGNSRDTATQFCFDLGSAGANLKLTVDYRDYYDEVPQTVIVSANGVELGILQSGKPIQIPRDVISEDGLLHVRFDYPNASTASELGEAGLTYLRAIHFNSILIEIDE